MTRAPETARFELTLPSRPVLDLALGTPEDGPVTFHVTIGRDGKDAAVLTHTVTTPYRWEPRVVDLADFAGEKVSLALSTSAERPGTIAFWGAPAVRQRVAREAGGPPQTVILIQGDTLRKDHLELYGYTRPTGPTLKRLAEDGAFFDNAITQTSWTKAATPSIHTSLYPSTHGVHQIPDRLPNSATTIAEVYRDAGYATLSSSPAPRTRRSTGGAKTAREFTDRLVDWLDGHRDIPVFVYLHFFDPHPPYEPNRPYDTMWADPKGREEYLREQEVVKKFVADPFLAQRGMATRDELAQAGLDPERFLQYSKDWYDGSIRGMDDEIGRLVERLRGLGEDGRSVIAFYADHGEEFHEHGRMWHGQSLYGFPNVAEMYSIMDGGWKLIQNVKRPPGKPEFELFDFYKDPLDQKDVAAQHPDVVARLARGLDGFRATARAARLKPDSESTKGMSQEQLEQLRSLGYVK